jgi:hypothetical protein
MDLRRAHQLSFPLAAFLGQDMAVVRLTALVSSRRGTLESLGGTTVGFHLGHCCYLVEFCFIKSVTSFWAPSS